MSGVFPAGTSSAITTSEVPVNAGNRSVAIVYDVAYPFVEGGGEKRMYEVASRLISSGWSVTWYTVHTWNGPATINTHGITYRGLAREPDRYTQSGRRSIRAALSFGLAAWRARSEIRRHPVLWCGQWPYFHLFALAPGYPGKLVVDWWETWGDHWYAYLGARGLVGKIIESAAARLFSRRGVLVTVTTMGRSDVLRVGARPQGTVVIPNGISLAQIRAVPAANNVTDIVYAGRLAKHKNVDHILHAVAMLRDRHRLSLTVSIIGDGPVRKQLESLSQQLDLESSVTFHGALPTPAMLAIIKSAGVFVHPSTKEGGGSITLLEANACGIPVVIYRHPKGIDPSLIEAGVNGWVEDEATVSALAARLNTIMRNRVALSSMRNGCESRARESDWAAVADRYETLFSADYGPQQQPATFLGSIT